MARVFSAVDIDDKEILEELERVRDALDLGFNTVPAEKMHVTLEFFQDASETEIEEIKAAAQETDVKPFSMDLKGVGVFPSKDYIRVIWAGIDSEEIFRLQEQVSRHGVKSDNDHDFHPHVTLARVENISPGKKKKLQKSLEEFENHSFGTATVKSVKLFESELTPGGASYKVLHEEEL